MKQPVGEIRFAQNLHQVCSGLWCYWIRVGLLLDHFVLGPLTAKVANLSQIQFHFKCESLKIMKIHYENSWASHPSLVFLVEKPPRFICIFLWWMERNNGYLHRGECLLHICQTCYPQFMVDSFLVLHIGANFVWQDHSPMCGDWSVFDALPATWINEVTRVGGETLLRQIASRWHSRICNLVFAINQKAGVKDCFKWIPVCWSGGPYVITKKRYPQNVRHTRKMPMHVAFKWLTYTLCCLLNFKPLHIILIDYI